MSKSRQYLADIINEMAQHPVEGEQTALVRLAKALWNRAFDGDQHATKMIYELLIKRPPVEPAELDEEYKRALEKICPSEEGADEPTRVPFK